MTPLEGDLQPGQKWVFDDEVTKDFDSMLERSIPQYAVMRDLVTKMAARFIQHKTAVVDLGCSRGEALDPLIRKFGAYNKYVGVEVSEPMANAARERFGNLVDDGVVTIANEDLRTYFPPVYPSVVLSVLTLQFTPIEYRSAIVNRVYEHMKPSGAFILVEKVLGATGTTDLALVELYHDLKREAGYSQDEIDRKRFALEGVLVPVTARWNEEMLTAAGFRYVECFWRCLNFAAWVAVK